MAEGEWRLTDDEWSAEAGVIRQLGGSRREVIDINVLQGGGVFRSLKYIDDLEMCGPIGRRPERRLKPQTRD